MRACLVGEEEISSYPSDAFVTSAPSLVSTW